MKPKLLNYIPYLSVLIFALLSLFFLIVRNEDVLFMHQMRSLFICTSDFLLQYLSKPAGFLQWAGCYFTQLFYYPALGSGVLFLMWTATFFFLKKGLQIPDTLSPVLLIPLVCLLASEIDLKYWIYYNKNAGYCFSPTLGILIAAAFIWLYRSFTNKLSKTSDTICKCLLSLLLALLFHFIGVYTLITLAVIGIIMAMEKRWILSFLNFMLIIVAPLLYKQLYTTLRSDEIFTVGLPVFQSGNVVNNSLTTPFFIAMGSLMFFTLLYKIGERLRNEKKSFIVSGLLLIVLTAGAILTLKSADHNDEVFRTECRTYRAIDEQRWEDVINDIRKVEGPLSRQLIIFKNIALFNTHEIGSKMYEFDDKGMIPSSGDSLQVNMVNTATPIIYLQHGMANYAYRWCMETQVDYGFNIASLKIMILAAIISGEGKLAEKYLNILSHTMFYKDWANHYLPLARDPKLIDKYPELTKIKELHSCIKNQVDSDEGICENFIVDYFSSVFNEDSKYFQEMTLVYSIRSKDIKRFWPHYLEYLQLHKGEKIPEIYQQVAILYRDLEPQTAPDPEAYQDVFDKEKVVGRYQKFDQETQTLVNMGFSDVAVARQTKDEFGDTFWWAYYFSSGAKCY